MGRKKNNDEVRTLQILLALITLRKYTGAIAYNLRITQMCLDIQLLWFCFSNDCFWFNIMNVKFCSADFVLEPLKVQISFIY